MFLNGVGRFRNSDMQSFKGSGFDTRVGEVKRLEKEWEKRPKLRKDNGGMYIPKNMGERNEEIWFSSC